jgi:hypothetical protein
MSYMADKDHIAITSRDTSTTRRKFCTGCPVFCREVSLSVSLATLIVASCPDWEILPGKVPVGLLDTQSVISDGTAGLIKLRSRLATAKTRGVNQHCRIVAYRSAARRSSR